MHHRAFLLEPVASSFWKQGAQIHARNQHVGPARRCEQRIVQHPQKHLGAGALYRGVEGRHAQRLYQIGHHLRPQLGAQLLYRQLGRASETITLPVQSDP